MARTSGRMIQKLVSPRSNPGGALWRARPYAVTMAVPGTARMRVLSPSRTSRPGTRVRASSHAIGTPTTMQISTARVEYRKLLTMYFGVSTITRSKNCRVYCTGMGVIDQPRPTEARSTPAYGMNDASITSDRKRTASAGRAGESRRRATREDERDEQALMDTD